MMSMVVGCLTMNTTIIDVYTSEHASDIFSVTILAARLHWLWQRLCAIRYGNTSMLLVMQPSPEPHYHVSNGICDTHLLMFSISFF